MTTLVLCGCVERVDAPLPVDRDLAAQASQWQQSVSFGGHAELAVESEDPWKQRFTEGAFDRISGLDATAGEVWVCDLGISRIQVFDYDGALLRTLGSGVPVRGTGPDDRALYQYMLEEGRLETPFELSPEGQRWIGSEREHFVAADIYVEDRAYVIADQAHTGIETSAKRMPGIVRIPFDTALPITRLPGVEEGWPVYVAGRGELYAASDSLRNDVFLMAPAREEGMPHKLFGMQVKMSDVLGALFAPAEHPIPYPQLLLSAGQASGEPGRFNNPGGMAIAFDKLIACDSGNRRIQVFEARADEEYFWGKLLRTIESRSQEGQQRFIVPRDIDVAPDGRMYLLDTERQEVVELSPTFDRLGIAARGFGDAYALALSPDGRHIFVSDRGDDMVHHYVRTD